MLLESVFKDLRVYIECAMKIQMSNSEDRETAEIEKLQCVRLV